jgi:hypothetical protein
MIERGLPMDTQKAREIATETACELQSLLWRYGEARRGLAELYATKGDNYDAILATEDELATLTEKVVAKADALALAVLGKPLDHEMTWLDVLATLERG